MFWGVEPTTLGLLLVALCAATLNGAMGYGFSSIVTPIAILWFTNRQLNPALILVELGVNLTLLYRERRVLAGTWRRAAALLPGLLPGVAVGSLGLFFLAPQGVRIVVYTLLLPLVFLQLLGVRRHITRERRSAPLVGAGVGLLYSLTTISGPPLALYWRNQGLSKEEFRAAMAQVRVAESSFTVAAYGALGLFTPSSLGLVPALLIPVLLGIPLGALIVRRVSRDSFSRLVMAADAGIVSYGLSRVVVGLGWTSDLQGWILMGLLVVATLATLLVGLRRVPLDVGPPGAPTDRGPGQTPLPAGRPPGPGPPGPP